MDEFLKLTKNSKTMKSGLVTIILGILLLLGIGSPESPETIDDMNNQPDNHVLHLIGLGALGSGLRTLEGRKDVEKRNKEKENNG